MKFTECHSSVVFFMYCSAAVLVIVNGQPTIDDDIDKDQISILINIVTELRAEQSRSAAKFRAQQERSVAQIGKLEDKVAKLEGQLAATSTVKPDAFARLCDFCCNLFLFTSCLPKGCEGLSNFSLYKTCSKALRF